MLNLKKKKILTNNLKITDSIFSIPGIDVHSQVLHRAVNTEKLKSNTLVYRDVWEIVKHVYSLLLTMGTSTFQTHGSRDETRCPSPFDSTTLQK